MLRFADDPRVNRYREAIDVHCGIDTLAALVDDSMQMDPLARAV
ncbi:transposase [Caballeronia zhejiangensis]|nr:transposase [Caballeronia zhejiangensis]